IAPIEISPPAPTSPKPKAHAAQQPPAPTPAKSNARAAEQAPAAAPRAKAAPAKPTTPPPAVAPAAPPAVPVRVEEPTPVSDATVDVLLSTPIVVEPEIPEIRVEVVPEVRALAPDSNRPVEPAVVEPPAVTPPSEPADDGIDFDSNADTVEVEA